jgi:2-phospho-L-lactate/phosphoenolpyruvate guanylyltransferase
MEAAAVLVPVKAFATAKLRLAAAMDGPARAALAREMADHVLDAAFPLQVAVVCDDEEVAAWARGRGALVLEEPGRGLNGAVEAGMDALAAMGVERVVVAHADLPEAVGLAALAAYDGIVLVPDRRDDGTNVISVPTDIGFRFSYGPGSFARHEAHARELGTTVHILRRADLALDIDSPADLLARR